eukprot:12122-Heterococcus_DN1.PRE.4
MRPIARQGERKYTAHLRILIAVLETIREVIELPVDLMLQLTTGNVSVHISYIVTPDSSISTHGGCPEAAYGPSG